MNRIERARAAWRNRGQARPSFAAPVDDGQESVWDYPRPPCVEPDARRVAVSSEGVLLADTTGAVRVLETASPPTFYLPPSDVRQEALVRVGGQSFCEWKGAAAYFALAEAPARPVAWCYEEPFEEFAALAGWFSFYPSLVACEVAGERVRPQPGSFYGGWVTDEIVGPFKGERGSESW